MYRFIMGCLLLTLAASAIAQEKPAFDQFAINALFNKQVQRDLDLVEEQTKEISEYLKGLTEYRDKLASELRELKAAGQDQQALNQRRDEMRKELEKEKQKIQSQVMEILLPHQRQRLKQVSAQFMNREAMKESKVPTGLLTPKMVDYLEIDSKQAKRIEQRSQELAKELAKKVEQLKSEAIEDLMKELSPKQRKKYSELMGERFDR